MGRPATLIACTTTLSALAASAATPSSNSFSAGGGGSRPTVEAGARARGITQQQHSRLLPTTTRRSTATAAATLPFAVSVRGGTSNRNEKEGVKKEMRKKRRNGKSTAAADRSDRDPTAPSTSKGSSSKTKKHKDTESAQSTLPIVEEILQHDDDYYKILGLTSKEHLGRSKHPERDVQKAYRRRAVQTHPDKTGGDRRAFDKVAEAYECLQDPAKRRLYDRHGKAGMQQQQFGGGGGAAGMNPEDLFRSFFANSPFFSSSSSSSQHFDPRPRRPVRYQMEVSLEVMYAGASPTITLPNGATVTVEIPRGASHHQLIAVSSDEENGMEDAAAAPDVVLILEQIPHRLFERSGHDLLLTIQISLSEALTGMQRKIRHLDGRVLHVVSPGGGSGGDAPVVIRTNDVHLLRGQGMPKNAVGTEFGDLFVQYEVQMPTGPPSSRKSAPGLTREERRELQRLLAKLEGKPAKDSQWPFATEAQKLETASASDFGRGSRNNARQQQQQQGFDPGFSPFGGQRFYWSSQSSSNPYTGSTDVGDDNGESQCRQM
jgi:curved DNA-binding protein